MRAGWIAMVVVGLALWGADAVAQSSPTSPMSQPAQPSQVVQLAQPPQASESPSPSPASQPSEPPQSSPPAQAAHPRYSADGLYNLANSYARAGKPGLAVLNYERAALLAPDDADINANLNYVRAAAHVPTETRNRFARIAQAAGPTLAAWIGVLGIVLIGAGLLLTKRIGRRFRWVRVSSVLLGVALIAMTVSNAALQWPRMHEAVVLVNQTPARVSPVPMGDTAFVLSEAETVTIAAEHEDFMLIRTRGGLTGWVARANLGAVVP